MKHYTTVEQSKKLLELGMNPESADMYYMEVSYNNYTIGVLRRIERDMLLNQAEYYKMFPCWSLGALLEVIPFNTQITTSYKNTRVDIIYKKGIKNSLHTETAETLLEALIQTICWLLENGYIKKGTKDF